MKNKNIQNISHGTALLYTIVQGGPN